MTQSSDRLDRIEAAIASLTELVRTSTQNINLIAERLDNIANTAVEAQQRAADAHQEASISTDLALQSLRQCERIWEYLLSQNPNGKGDMSDDST
ncbi:MAG: hypothetical protein F6K36_28700 [Symploca sp. SIO3C6]|uniref:Uncharacterized protein n=1 Tax=Symploca sp. SIO1C4 TaxID=2607765 RepID=A0A6B3NE76_9CYAN|nr:hypothetical protein [Symploca sp. SIO3C6]NER29215.1 hypothetical protein [Symploca sp. SIO1C4]